MTGEAQLFIALNAGTSVRDYQKHWETTLRRLPAPRWMAFDGCRATEATSVTEKFSYHDFMRFYVDYTEILGYGSNSVAYQEIAGVAPPVTVIHWVFPQQDAAAGLVSFHHQLFSITLGYIGCAQATRRQQLLWRASWENPEPNGGSNGKMIYIPSGYDSQPWIITFFNR